jgi:hypothetical protein
MSRSQFTFTGYESQQELAATIKFLAEQAGMAIVFCLGKEENIPYLSEQDNWHLPTIETALREPNDQVHILMSQMREQMIQTYLSFLAQRRETDPSTIDNTVGRADLNSYKLMERVRDYHRDIEKQRKKVSDAVPKPVIQMGRRPSTVIDNSQSSSRSAMATPVTVTIEPTAVEAETNENETEPATAPVPDFTNQQIEMSRNDIDDHSLTTSKAIEAVDNSLVETMTAEDARELLKTATQQENEAEKLRTKADRISEEASAARAVAERVFARIKEDIKGSKARTENKVRR